MVRQLDTLEEFQECVLGPRGKVIVVDFWASWCGPCHQVAPFFEKQQEKYPEVSFYKVEIDENTETAAHAGIRCMPTFKFYKEGECVETIQGGAKGKITAALDKWTATAAAEKN